VAVSTAVSGQTGPMPSGLADREGVQGDQVTGAGGEGQNPNGPSFGCRGQDPGGGCGELGQGSDPLGPPAEPVAPQELVDPDGDRRTRWSARWPTSWRAPRVGRATASASTPSTWSGGVAVGIPGGRRSLGSSAASPQRWRGRPSGRRSCGRSRRCGRPRPRWSARPGPGPGHAGGR
jgi:hypothetical protein